MDLPNAGKNWSDEELSLLRERFEAGLQLEALCREHGRSPYSIITQLQRLGLLTQMGYHAYHRVHQEPWVLVSVVRNLNDTISKV